MSKFSDKAADKLAGVMGSWPFVLGQFVFLTVWFAVNLTWSMFAWDPYPFILANLVMSAQAAFATPILLMSQNRSAALESRRLKHDVELDEEALEIIKRIERKLDG